MSWFPKWSFQQGDMASRRLHLRLVTTTHPTMESMHIRHQCVVLHAYNKCVKYQSNAIHRTHIAKRNRLTLFSKEALLHSCIKSEVLKNLQVLIFIVGSSTYSWGLDNSSRLIGLQTGSFRLAPNYTYYHSKQSYKLNVSRQNVYQTLPLT